MEKRMLIIEDEPDIQDILQYTFSTDKNKIKNGELVYFSNDGKSVIISNSMNIDVITKVEFNK